MPTENQANKLTHCTSSQLTSSKFCRPSQTPGNPRKAIFLGTFLGNFLGKIASQGFPTNSHFPTEVLNEQSNISFDKGLFFLFCFFKNCEKQKVIKDNEDIPAYMMYILLVRTQLQAWGIKMKKIAAFVYARTKVAIRNQRIVLKVALCLLRTILDTSYLSRK